jgi:hypothetical protein
MSSAIQISKSWRDFLHLGIALTGFISLQAFSPRTLQATDWSTLFTAQDVRDHLSTPEGREQALGFCRRMRLTKVYIEAFRDGYQADAETLGTARDFFRQAGLRVSGCVTTTQLGKPSTGWNIVACYTHRANQDHLASIFSYAAGIFDEIMIDDFFFTDCECSECSALRGQMSWRDYREKLMLDMSRENVLGAARRVNPKVKIILKFPQWYDKFQEPGYTVDKESALYDRVWVGTETRDPASDRWGHKQQYEGFFIFRWISDIAGEKTGGGWFDPYGTNSTNYLDQAYVTVLAGAPEVFLFHYGALHSPEYHAQAEALAARRSELDALSKLVGDWRGIPAYKPPSSDAGSEAYLFDQIGMLGIPLLPAARFPQNARVALFTEHSLEDPDFVFELVQFLSKGGTAFLSEGLAHRLNGDPRLPSSERLELSKGETFRKVEEGGGSLLVFSDALARLTTVDAHNHVAEVTPELSAALDQLRTEVSNFAVTLRDAPPRVAVFPMGGRVAVMNFNETPVACRIQGLGGMASRKRQVFATNGAALAPDGATFRLPPHALLVVE